MDKVLITGGAGFIGSFLAETMVNLGLQVTVFDNLFRGAERNLRGIEKKIEIIKGDVTDETIVRKAVKDKNTVFHMAAIQGTKNFYEVPVKVLKVNILGTFNVLESCVRTNVQRVIFASSSEVYGYPKYFPVDEEHPMQISDSRNPRYSYATSKMAGESLCINYAKTYGYEATILRFFNVYGPRMGYDHVIPQFVIRILKGGDFTVQGDGNQTRSFCYVTDAVKGTILAATNPKAANQIFNIGNPEEITINRLAKLVSKTAGVRIEPKHVPLPEGGTPRRVPDIGKAKNILGYEPEVSLKEGLRMTFEWYKSDLLNSPK